MSLGSWMSYTSFFLKSLDLKVIVCLSPNDEIEKDIAIEFYSKRLLEALRESTSLSYYIPTLHLVILLLSKL